MPITHSAATLAAVALALISGLQLLLAAGLPLGRIAWGGQYRVLPHRLRWASLGAAVVLAVAIWMVLARAGLVAPGADPVAVRVVTWALWASSASTRSATSCRGARWSVL